MKNVYDEAQAASRYNAARDLPEETKDLWLNALRCALPASAGAVGLFPLFCAALTTDLMADFRDFLCSIL